MSDEAAAAGGEQPGTTQTEKPDAAAAAGGKVSKLAAAAAALAGEGGEAKGGKAGEGKAPNGEAGKGAAEKGTAKAYRPENPDYPKDWFAETDPETIDRLAKVAKDSRDAIAKRGSVPKDATGYSFKPTEALKPFFGDDMANDPAFRAFATEAHKLGITQQQFEGFIGGGFDQLAKAGVLPQPFNPKVEVDKIIADHKGERNEAVKYITDMQAFADGLASQAPEDAIKGEIAALSDSRDGLRTLAWLKDQLDENGIRPGGQGGGDAVTKDWIAKMDGDPRIDPTNENHIDPKRRYDPALRAKYDKGYQKLFK